jgi:hypothetical protein
VKYTRTKKHELNFVKSTINNRDWRQLTSERSAKCKNFITSSAS